jgi:polysaccharide export outer membrane protein
MLVVWLLAGAGALSAQAALAPIQPGDVVRVRIWREPDLSGEFPVDESGTVVLPRLGSLRVSGESAQAFRTRVVSAYEVFLSHSSVEVTVLRRLLVLGAVRNPGLYQVDPTMTVEDGLALAGGVTPDGNPNHMTLIRHGERQPVRVTMRTQFNGTSIRSGDQLYIPERSWASRNPGVIVGVLSVATTTAVLLLRR